MGSSRHAGWLGSVLVALTLSLPTGCGDDAPDDADFTIADLNLLHGLFCPSETDSCRLDDRIELFFQWIEGSGCPDVITVQEVLEPIADKMRDRQTSCGFTYEVAHLRINSVDDALILSRYPANDVEAIPLFKDFRYVLAATIDHPRGPIEVLTTHLASGTDGATDPCGADCPTECVAAGAATVRECQSVQLADITRARLGPDRLGFVTGDFNAAPWSFAYNQMVDSGWLDTYLEAGNPECNAATGDGCTSGRQDEILGELEAPEKNQDERIDYVFAAVPAAAGSGCEAVIEPAGDPDGDGAATGGWADRPNPYAATCGPNPDPICWPSDHGGVLADLSCTPNV